MTVELGEITLERQFEFVDRHGDSGIITLRLGKPTIQSDSDSSLKWRCPFQIVGLGPEKLKEAPGMDAVDAVLNSLRLAEVLLTSYGQSYNTKITWHGEVDLGLSLLPVASSEQDRNPPKGNDDPFKKVFDDFFRNFDRDSADKSR
jgi:hypothetical protein